MIKIPEKLSFLKRKIFLIPALVVIILVIFFIARSKNSGDGYETAVVARGVIRQEVLLSGKVSPKDKVELSFEQAGRVAGVLAETGQKVFLGQTLAFLSNGDQAAGLDRARATLSSAQANLAQVKRGSRPEEITIKEAELEKAKQDLENYYSSAPNTLSDAFDAADSAVTKQLDLLFSNDDSSSPAITFNVSNSQAKILVEAERQKITDTLARFRLLVENVNKKGGAADIETALKEGRANLELVRFLLVLSGDVLNSSTDLSAANLASYKADVAAARAAVTAAVSAVTAELNSIVSQKITVRKTENELALKKAGSTTEDVLAAEARVAESLADVRKAEAALSKTIIRAPFSGVITNKNVSVGQIVSANSPVFSIISLGNFEIKTDVPEVEIAKLKVGNTATATLDAYNAPFLVTVSEIDPAERVIDGVSTYQVTLNFKEEDSRIRSGMTANLKVKTDEKEGVLIIPQRAVFSKNSKKMTRVVTEGGKIEEKEVETGLEGENGKVEITKGLKEGETVVVSGKI